MAGETRTRQVGEKGFQGTYRYRTPPPPQLTPPRRANLPSVATKFRTFRDLMSLTDTWGRVPGQYKQERGRMSREHVHQLMTEIGPLLGLDEVVEYADQALWIVVFNDGQVLEAEYDAPAGRLVLSMDLGVPAADAAADLHRLLLQYNYPWRQTGGVRMALAGDTVVQMLELSDARLELQALARAFAGLHGNAVTWRALLAPAAGADDAASPDLHALRV